MTRSPIELSWTAKKILWFNFFLRIFTFGDIGPLFSGAENGGGGFPGSISLANYHSFLPVQSNQVKGPIIDRNEGEVLGGNKMAL